MGTAPEPSSPSPDRRDTVLMAILGLVLAVASWFAYTTLAAGPPLAVDATSAASWPTIPPTVTPFPSAPPATPVPTPTPLPTPAIERIAELATLAYTFEVIQDVTPEPESGFWDGVKQAIPGEDHVVLATTWKARYGVELEGAQVVDADSVDKAITLNLPPVTVLTVEQVGTARPVILSQQSVFSQAPELVLLAQNRAQKEARDRSRTNQEMLDVATDLTRLRLEDWMRELGYTSVTVNIPDGRTP